MDIFCSLMKKARKIFIFFLLLNCALVYAQINDSSEGINNIIDKLLEHTEGVAVPRDNRTIHKSSQNDSNIIYIKPRHKHNKANRTSSQEIDNTIKETSTDNVFEENIQAEPSTTHSPFSDENIDIDAPSQEFIVEVEKDNYGDEEAIKKAVEDVLRSRTAKASDEYDVSVTAIKDDLPFSIQFEHDDQDADDHSVPHKKLVWNTEAYPDKGEFVMDTLRTTRTETVQTPLAMNVLYDKARIPFNSICNTWLCYQQYPGTVPYNQLYNYNSYPFISRALMNKLNLPRGNIKHNLDNLRAQKLKQINFLTGLVNKMTSRFVYQPLYNNYAYY